MESLRRKNNEGNKIYELAFNIYKRNIVRYDLI